MNQKITNFDFYTSYERFKNHLQSIPNTRDAALFATIYCGYARVGEIVRGRYGNNPALTKEQLVYDSKHLILTILTEKTHQWRRVPTSAVKEKWLHDIIDDWLPLCGVKLFPYSTMWAEKKFEKWFGTQRIHLLRHWATTHALQGHRTKERLQAYHVARLGGWTDLNTFYKTYNHFIMEDFIDLV